MMASPTVIQKRNIIVLGKTGAGKSSVANRIVGMDLFEVTTSSVSSVTKHPSVKEASVIHDGIQYTFKTIDTVGLFDTAEKTNEEIFREAKTFIRERVPEGISLVLFVFKEGRFTPEERKTFESLTKNFGKSKITDISALIVTCCENMTPKARIALVEEMKSNERTNKITSFMKKGIYPVGFPNLKEVDPRIKEVHEETAKQDAETLHKLIRNCEDKMILSKDILTESFWEKLKSSCTFL